MNRFYEKVETHQQCWLIAQFQVLTILFRTLNWMGGKYYSFMWVPLDLQRNVKAKMMATDYYLLCTLKSLVKICLLRVYFRFSLHLFYKLKPVHVSAYELFQSWKYIYQGLQSHQQIFIGHPAGTVQHAACGREARVVPSSGPTGKQRNVAWIIFPSADLAKAKMFPLIGKWN